MLEEFFQVPISVLAPDIQPREETHVVLQRLHLVCAFPGNFRRLAEDVELVSVDGIF